MDGRPNPNLGRAFISGFPGWGEQKSERETKRAVAYGNLDFEEHFDGWGKWFGKHTLTALFEENETSRLSYGGPAAVVDPVFGSSIGYRTNHRRYDQRLRLGYVHYLDGNQTSFSGASSPAGAGLRGVNEYVEFPESLDFIYVDSNGLFQQSNFPIYDWIDNRERVTTSSSRRLIQVDSVALALQSKFLNDNLVATAGWREDEYREWNASGNNNDAVEDSLGSHDIHALSIDRSGDLDVDVKDETFSWGTVFHVPESFLPENTRVSLHYNESENFNPNATSVKPIAAFEGEQFDAPVGETEDYGVTLELMDGKLVIKGTWYETTQNNNADSTVRTAYRWFFERIPREVYGNNALADIQAAGFDQALPIDGVQTAWEWGFSDNPDDPAFRDLETRNISAGDITTAVSEGFEFEMHYNPNSNLRLFFNASQQEAVQTGIAQTAYDEVVRLNTLWNDPDILALNIGSGTVSSRVNQQLDVLNELRTQDGRASDELREWRANLGGTYSFDADSALSNWEIGGSLRWQDKSSIGYPIILINNAEGSTTPVRDISNPIFGPTNTQVDSWIRYRTKIWDEKINWTLQLNIRNLLDKDDLIPARLNYAGLPDIVRFNEGRRFILTSTFDF